MLADLVARNRSYRRFHEDEQVSEETLEQLVGEATLIRTRFRHGARALGAFIGLALGISLMNQVVFRRREDYEPHRGDCLSCGRCIDYCPIESKESTKPRIWTRKLK